MDGVRRETIHSKAITNYCRKWFFCVWVLLEMLQTSCIAFIIYWYLVFRSLPMDGCGCLTALVGFAATNVTVPGEFFFRPMFQSINTGNIRCLYQGLLTVFVCLPNNMQYPSIYNIWLRGRLGRYTVAVHGLLKGTWAEFERCACSPPLVHTASGSAWCSNSETARMSNLWIAELSMPALKSTTNLWIAFQAWQLLAIQRLLVRAGWSLALRGVGNTSEYTWVSITPPLFTLHRIWLAQNVLRITCISSWFTTNVLDDDTELLLLKAQRTLDSSAEELANAFKNDDSPCTVDVLEAERSWDNVPVGLWVPPLLLKHSGNFNSFNIEQLINW